MQRRKFVIGLGALAAGSSAAIGTGAVDSFGANRDANIDIVTDENALVGLSSDSPYALDDGSNGQLSIDITGNNENIYGDGVNNEAVTFIEDVFTIHNQSATDVYVWVQQRGGDGGVYAFVVRTDDGEATLIMEGTASLDDDDLREGFQDVGRGATFDDEIERGAIKLETGEYESVGFLVDTRRVDVEENPYDLLSRMAIRAESDKEDIPPTYRPE